MLIVQAQARATVIYSKTLSPSSTVSFSSLGAGALNSDASSPIEQILFPNLPTITAVSLIKIKPALTPINNFTTPQYLNPNSGFPVSPVPEPTSFWAGLLGLILVGTWNYRMRSQKRKPTQKI